MASKHVVRPDGATRPEKKWPGYCKTFIVKDSNGTVKELVFPKALDLDRPKRDRTTFSNRQLSRLEEEFNTNQYIVGKDRTTLAKRLGLSETQVKVWFQNRRTKLKKENGRKFEGSDSQAESKAAQNVLKLLAYQTSVSYPCLQNKVPAGHEQSAEAHLSPNGSKLLPSVPAPHTCLHAKARNEKQWPSVQTTPEHNIPTIYASSANDASKYPSDQTHGPTHLNSCKQDAVVHTDSFPVFQKHPPCLEVACSKYEEDGELTTGTADYRQIPQTSEHDDYAGKYSSDIGSTHFPIREFLEINTHKLTERSERASRSNSSHLNDSFNQDSNTLLVDNKLEQSTTQRITQTSLRETRSPSGCVQSHTMPSQRVEVSSWLQGYQSQYLAGPPFLSWYENGIFSPTSYSSIGQPPLHSNYGNIGPPNLTSAFSNIDQQIHTQYTRLGQPKPNLYPDFSGTTPLYSATALDHSSLGSATFEPQKYRGGFTMPYQSPSLGVHENTRTAIDLNLNKHLGFKFCTLQTPLSGTMRNEHMLNQLQTKFPYSYFNQS